MIFILYRVVEGQMWEVSRNGFPFQTWRGALSLKGHSP